MKKVFAWILVVSAVMISAAACSAEQVALKFDSRKWEVAYQNENAQQGIQKFLTIGDSLDKWTEMVTVQAFFGMQQNISPEDYMNGMIKSLKETCPNATSKVIKKGDADIVFEWLIKDCVGQENQYEIDRVIAGDKAMFVIHYATKNIPMPQRDRDAWIKLLENAVLKGD